MKKEIIVSTTAYQSGFGCDMFKSVCGLTREEKNAANDGVIIAFDCGRLSGGSHGTTWRVVKPRFTMQLNKKTGHYGKVPMGRFDPRVPDAETLARLENPNGSF